MNSHRRDILKLFGVGASIIPIIGGQPVLAAEAKLIEEPKIEPISIGSFDRPFMEALEDLTAYAEYRKVSMAVLHIDPVTGKRNIFAANTMIPLKQQVFSISFATTNLKYHEQIDWQLKGTLLRTPCAADKEAFGYIYSFA